VVPPKEEEVPAAPLVTVPPEGRGCLVRVPAMVSFLPFFFFLKKAGDSSSISRKWTIMGHIGLFVFLCVFHILLYAHAVQYGINFDNNIKI
jgi:hypothetical protein